MRNHSTSIAPLPAPFAGVPGIVLLEPLALRRLLSRHRIRFGATGIPIDTGGAVLRATELTAVIGEVASAPRLPASLPDWVVLLAWPRPRRAWQSRDVQNQRYLLTQDAIRQCVARDLLETEFFEEELSVLEGMLGPVGWEEAVGVLRRDGRLLPPFTKLTAARVFLAEAQVCLCEEGRFALWFPGIHAQAVAEFLASRLSANLRDRIAACMPYLIQPPRHSAPPREQRIAADQDLSEAIARAQRVNNHVRTLLLRHRAGEDVGPELSDWTSRLALALGWETANVGALTTSLAELVPSAAANPGSQAERFLQDLQASLLDHAHPFFTVDIVGAVHSFGRLGTKRELPFASAQATLKHVRVAQSRLHKLPLGESAREQLATALALSEAKFASDLRSRLEAALAGALEAAGLVPQNLPERRSLEKLIAELCDRAIGQGHLEFSDLRDALARNDLKLPDLAGIGQFALGDALLKADRILAVRLDGLYRPGEVYLRWFQSLSSLGFGTALGRWLVKFLALPIGGAFMLLEFLQHMVGPLLHKLSGVEISFVSWPSIIVLGLYALGLLHSQRVRDGSWILLRRIGLGLRYAFITLPRWLYSRTALRWLLHTPWARWLGRTVLPSATLSLACWLLLWLYDIPTHLVHGAALGLFAVLLVFLNTWAGRWLEERAIDSLLQSWDLLRVDFLPGLLRLIVDFFRWLLDGLERLLYVVDEWLRYRPGELPWSIALKGVLTFLWFWVTYLIRFAIRLLVEPQINPLKHFPVVTVSHKLLLPTIPAVAGVFRQLMPEHALYADALAGALITCIPGVFGFLAWELKENWRLYQANRPKDLEAEVVGHHGETVLRLLRPGFHSGTVPRQFARMRAARSGRARSSALRKAKKELHHVAQALTHLVEREFIAFLAASKRWRGAVPHVQQCRLTTNAIEMKLTSAAGEPWGQFKFAWFGTQLHANFTLAEAVRRNLKPAPSAAIALAAAGLLRRVGVAEPVLSPVRWADWVEAWQEKQRPKALLNRVKEELARVAESAF